MAAARPLTANERDRIREMHATGATRNTIATALGRSPSTVSTAARAMDLSFDRTATAAATQARTRDYAARRAALLGRMYGRSEHIVDRLDAPTYKHTATTVNGIETAELDHVPAEAERHLSGALSGYLTAAAKLEAIDAGNKSEGAQSMLGNLAEALGITERAAQ
ncbi:helix-turn-helix domain-containing protein [Saccharopolyspora cebuensis]|uniref:Helix-turn-helix domain-containing protein n=1 Tax=Saccharopolyspora cebuensis TaxID=418759 RepID=A0ABV4CFX1_9PSEU